MSFSSSFGTSGRPSVPPLEVRLTRNDIGESLHRVHAVVCDQRGRVLMRAGDPQQLSFIRSALKPFQAQVFVASGTADAAGRLANRRRPKASPPTANPHPPTAQKNTASDKASGAPIRATRWATGAG